MVTQAETLAAKFEQANDAVIRAVEGMPDAHWQAPCPNDGRPVGVVAHHVAMSHPAIGGLVQMVATGQPLPPLTPEMIDQGNAQHAHQYAAATKAETLDLLRRNGQAAAAALRGLTDEQLQRTGALFGQQVSAAQIVENVLVGHPQGHLATIMSAA